MGRQRSRNHMREQKRDPDKMKSSNLTDAEFKILVIKMLNELLGSVDKFSKDIKNIKVEIDIMKGNQSEMKNTLSEMKSILNGINKVNKEEDQVTYIEDGEDKTLN